MLLSLPLHSIPKCTHITLEVAHGHETADVILCGIRVGDSMRLWSCSSEQVCVPHHDRATAIVRLFRGG